MLVFILATWAMVR